MAAIFTVLLCWVAVELGGFDVVDLDEDEPGSSSGRVALGVLSASVASAPLAAALLYAGHYVIAIEREGRELVVATIGLLVPRRRRFPVAQVIRAEYHEGYLEGASPATPWIALHVAGRRLPYLVDMQAETINRSAIYALAPRD